MMTGKEAEAYVQGCSAFEEGRPSQPPAGLSREAALAWSKGWSDAAGSAQAA